MGGSAAVEHGVCTALSLPQPFPHTRLTSPRAAQAIDPQHVNSSAPLSLQRYHELLPEYPNLYIAWVRTRNPSLVQCS